MEKSIEQLKDYVFANMGAIHQITIDFTENVYGYYQRDVDENDPEEIEDKLRYMGAEAYDIRNTLEVFNPEFKKEKEVMENLLKILDVLILEQQRMISALRA